MCTWEGPTMDLIHSCSVTSRHRVAAAEAFIRISWDSQPDNMFSAGCGSRILIQNVQSFRSLCNSLFGYLLDTFGMTIVLFQVKTY